jgi:hypothetical protein
MSRYEDLAVKAASQGQWGAALQYAKMDPNAWDKLPQYNMPDDAMEQALDHFDRNPWLKTRALPGFLFEYSGNIPNTVSPKILNRVAELGKEDGYVTENIHSHPNWAPDERTKGLMQAATHWNNYERTVHPAHFATAKSMFTGQPETITDHRGNTGSSEQTTALHPHLKDYAKLTQNAVLADAKEFPWNPKDHEERENAMRTNPFTALDPRIHIKHIKGEPHIRLFRGISGDYAEKLAQIANLDDSGNVDKKILNIPTAHMTSWSIDPHMAKSFATTRAQELPNQTSKRALVLEKWIPVKDILHSGFHKVVTNQDHAHRSEFEIVVGHKDGKVKVPTKNIHIPKAVNEHTHILEPVKVRETEPVQKSEDDFIGTIHDMLGINSNLRASLEAARFLANKEEEVPYEIVRQLLWEHEDADIAALLAYGLECTDDNLRALQAIKEMMPMAKSEYNTKEVRPANESAQDVAEEVQRAFMAEMVDSVALKGKHAAGALIAQDPATKHSYLLKPGSGGQSSALGATEQPATQSEREAAFYHAMKVMGLESAVPRTELIYVDGKEVAAMNLLSKDYINLERLRQSDFKQEEVDLLPLLRTGLLHQWAAADFILGQSDRHANNVMVSRKTGDLKLIDHGSALAGASFNPGHDKNSFVPAYLRAWAPPAFNKLSVEEKLAFLPRLSTDIAQEVGQWLANIDAQKLANILVQFHVEPSAIIARLEKLRDLTKRFPADLSINWAWIK